LCVRGRRWGGDSFGSFGTKPNDYRPCSQSDKLSCFLQFQVSIAPDIVLSSIMRSQSDQWWDSCSMPYGPHGYQGYQGRGYRPPQRYIQAAARPRLVVIHPQTPYRPPQMRQVCHPTMGWLRNWRPTASGSSGCFQNYLSHPIPPSLATTFHSGSAYILRDHCNDVMTSD
jgi:hypothetical protein